jgi:hypothetical protein
MGYGCAGKTCQARSFEQNQEILQSKLTTFACTRYGIWLDGRCASKTCHLSFVQNTRQVIDSIGCISAQVSRLRQIGGLKPCLSSWKSARSGLVAQAQRRRVAPWQRNPTESQRAIKVTMNNVGWFVTAQPIHYPALSFRVARGATRNLSQYCVDFSSLALVEMTG